MKNFLKNILDDIKISEKDTKIIDLMSSVSGKKKIVLQDTSNLTYLIVAKDADLDIDVHVGGVGSDCQIFGLFISDGKPSKIKLTVHNEQSNTKTRVHLVSLLYDDGNVDVDANIDIKKGLKNIVGHLLEENIILGKNISIKTLAILSVASKDVQASHGAKVEKIDQSKLFYMASKGLKESDAQILIVDGYVNDMLSYFDDFPEQELLELRQFLKK